MNMGIYVERSPILSSDYQNCLSSKSEDPWSQWNFRYTQIQMREDRRDTRKHKNPRPTPSSLKYSSFPPKASTTPLDISRHRLQRRGEKKKSTT